MLLRHKGPTPFGTPSRHQFLPAFGVPGGHRRREAPNSTGGRSRPGWSDCWRMQN